MRDGLSWRNYVIAARRRTSVSSEPFVSPLPSQVHVKVSVPKGIKFVGHPGKHHLTRKKCVPPGEATPTSIVLSVTELGPANITGHYLFPHPETFCLKVGRFHCPSGRLTCNVEGVLRPVTVFIHVLCSDRAHLFFLSIKAAHCRKSDSLADFRHFVERS